MFITKAVNYRASPVSEAVFFFVRLIEGVFFADLSARSKIAERVREDDHSAPWMIHTSERLYYIVRLLRSRGWFGDSCCAACCVAQLQLPSNVKPGKQVSERCNGDSSQHRGRMMGGPFVGSPLPRTWVDRVICAGDDSTCNR